VSLDIYLSRIQETEVHSQNITHNLNKMASEAGLYGVLWRPEENAVETAADLICTLERGIADMKNRPEHFEQFNASNGFGTYSDFVPWLEELLEACREYPDAKIRASR
jgi:hypothetical protein